MEVVPLQAGTAEEGTAVTGTVAVAASVAVEHS